MKNKKINLVEIIWLFILGSIFGYILECSWYFIKHAVWINKQGLLYGPFKPIYGIGLVLIVLLMNNFKNKKLYQKFLMGSLIGGVFEYICSLFLEYVMHTSTWDYSNFKFNILGRVYLPYILIWGILGILVIDYFYPFFKNVLNKIKPKTLKIITIIVSILMSLNIIITFIAINRYTTRNRNPNVKTVFKIIDNIYDDEYMEHKFPKHKIIKE